MAKTLLVSAAGWGTGAAFGILLLGAAKSFHPLHEDGLWLAAMLGGGSGAIVAALASIGADIVAAIRGKKPPEQDGSPPAPN
jgi:hypothetical protein